MSRADLLHWRVMYLTTTLWFGFVLALSLVSIVFGL
jgi:hypothetical protein